MLLLTSGSRHLVSIIKETTSDESLLDISYVHIMIEHAFKNSKEVAIFIAVRGTLIFSTVLF